MIGSVSKKVRGREQNTMSRERRDQSTTIDFTAPDVRHADTIEIVVHGTNDPREAATKLAEFALSFVDVTTAPGAPPARVTWGTIVGRQHIRLTHAYPKRK
jgi:hypothetical protein